MTDAVRRALEFAAEHMHSDWPERCQEIVRRARAALSEQPEASDWAGEEWERLAWHLCAEESGEEACNELVWEGGPIPEPWGDRWMKYEGEAKRMIAMVRQHVAHSAPVERVTLSDEQVLACIRSAQVGPVPMGMTRERGPYDVTEPTYFAQRFARAVIAEYERLNGISATPRQPLSEARIEEQERA